MCTLCINYILLQQKNTTQYFVIVFFIHNITLSERMFVCVRVYLQNGTDIQINKASLIPARSEGRYILVICKLSQIA